MLNIVQKKKKEKKTISSFLIVAKILNKILLIQIQMYLIRKIPLDQTEFFQEGKDAATLHVNVIHYNNQLKRIIP